MTAPSTRRFKQLLWHRREGLSEQKGPEGRGQKWNDEPLIGVQPVQAFDRQDSES